MNSTVTAAVFGPETFGNAPCDRPWWRDAVVYQVYPRSFADSDGDGIGDLPGIIDRLGHIKALGADALWLSPFYNSPQADAGYDVSDYRSVDPVFGTLDDARVLLRRAHELDLRVIVDIVPNHCSDQHAWFRQALADGPGSAARDRFHFRPGRGEGGELPPNDWESVFGGPAWSRVTGPDGTPGEWYLHLFAPEQPDFDWEHPEVREEFRTTLRFWLDLGVDGFRVDVAHALIKAPGLPDVGHAEQKKLEGLAPLPYFDQDGVHEIFRDWRTILDEYPGDRMAVAEAFAPSQARNALYVRPDELHQAFNFPYVFSRWDAHELRSVITETLGAIAGVGGTATWTLSSHDRIRHRTRLAEGIAPEAALRRARAATLLMLALPGAAYLYQGEELGLPEVADLPDEVRQDPAYFRPFGDEGLRDGCRVPLPWSGDHAPFGFGPVEGGPSWLPQPADWAVLTAERQDGDPDSTLEFYRAALAVRRQHPALGAGDDLSWLDAPDGVIAFRRDTPEASFICTVNLTGEPVALPAPGRPLLASAPLAGDEMIPADTTIWWTA